MYAPQPRSMSVQPRTDPSAKYNANIIKTLQTNKVNKRKGSALRFTNRMLPEIDLGQTGRSNNQGSDKFISIVPEKKESKINIIQKRAFQK